MATLLPAASGTVAAAFKWQLLGRWSCAAACGVCERAGGLSESPPACSDTSQSTRAVLARPPPRALRLMSAEGLTYHHVQHHLHWHRNKIRRGPWLLDGLPGEKVALRHCPASCAHGGQPLPSWAVREGTPDLPDASCDLVLSTSCVGLLAFRALRTCCCQGARSAPAGAAFLSPWRIF